MDTRKEAGFHDRRVLRTRQTIEEAFIRLVNQQTFESITIRVIAEQANVNRTTFYAHFTDKYDLLAKALEGKLSLLRQQLQESIDSGGDAAPVQPEEADPYYVAFFHHLAEYERYYRIILTLPLAHSHLTKMHAVVRDSIYDRILRIGPAQKLLIPLDLLLDYMSASLMGIGRRWLEQQMIYTPRYMALQFTRLSQTGTYQAMGLSNHR